MDMPWGMLIAAMEKWEGWGVFAKAKALEFDPHTEISQRANKPLFN